MKSKEFFIICVVIALLSLGAVSAGFFDFLGGGTSNDTANVSSTPTDEELLINSTTIIKCGEASESSEYAWFTQSGEYVKEAYDAPYEVTSTINMDIEKMYEQLGYDNYSLDDFKQDLEKANENGTVANIMDFEIQGEKSTKPLISGNRNCEIDNKSNVLTINYVHTRDDLTTQGGAQDLDELKNATSCSFEVAWHADTDMYKDVQGREKTDLDKITLSSHIIYTDQPVKVESL